MSVVLAETVRGFHGTSSDRVDDILQNGFRVDAHRNMRSEIYFSTSTVGGLELAVGMAIARTLDDHTESFQSINRGIEVPVIVVDVPVEVTEWTANTNFFTVSAMNSGLIAIREVVQVQSNTSVSDLPSVFNIQ